MLLSIEAGYSTPWIATPSEPRAEMRAFAKAGPTVEPILPVSVEPRANIKVTGAQTDGH